MSTTIAVKQLADGARSEELFPFYALQRFIKQLHCEYPQRIKQHKDGTVTLTTRTRNLQQYTYHGELKVMAPILAYALLWAKLKAASSPHEPDWAVFIKPFEELVRSTKGDYPLDLPERRQYQSWRQSLGDIRLVGVLLLGFENWKAHQDALEPLLREAEWEDLLATSLVCIYLGGMKLEELL